MKKPTTITLSFILFSSFTFCQQAIKAKSGEQTMVVLNHIKFDKKEEFNSILFNEVMPAYYAYEDSSAEINKLNDMAAKSMRILLPGNMNEDSTWTFIMFADPLYDGTDGVELWGECYSIQNTTELNLGENQLTGAIPPEIGNLTNLTYLNLQDNQLTGSIPPEIGNLTNLTYLNLDGNELTGSIPSEIGNLTNLTYLNLEDNLLTGSIPSEIGNLTYLERLYLNRNQFTGSIPSEIGNLDSLTYLNLGDNPLTGFIPSEIGNLVNLDFLDISDSYQHSGGNLTGPIPSEIGNLINLTQLRLEGNFLTGSIPSEIGNLTNLTRLFLGYNLLTGSIPSEIGNLTNLTVLYLGSNQLTGQIPENICDLVENNCYIDISNNQLCPPYPSCIEYYVGEQDTTNCGQVSIIDETLPIAYNLYNAYPNPFNPITTLRYDLPKDAVVNITIYDMMGRQINTLVSGPQNAGYKSIQWNATNNIGQPVSAGVYLYKIQAGEFRQTKKMVLLK